MTRRILKQSYHDTNSISNCIISLDCTKKSYHSCFFLEIKKGNDDLDTCVWWLMSSSPKLFFAEFIFCTNNIKISKTRERIPQGCEMMARKRNMSIHNGPSAAQAIGLPFCQGRQRQNLLFGSSSWAIFSSKKFSNANYSLSMLRKC